MIVSQVLPYKGGGGGRPPPDYGPYQGPNSGRGKRQYNTSFPVASFFLHQGGHRKVPGDPSRWSSDCSWTIEKSKKKFVGLWLILI